MSAKRIAMKKAPGLVPASEERVYLYQKTGKDMLEELEAKRLRYEELDKSLQLLPRKLRHPGLVPLGPGLYGHGQMVNTNEIMVLLGDSYFAEMSAYDARGVVKRRLKIIDERIESIQVGTNEIEEVLTDMKKQKESIPKAKRKVPSRPAFAKGFLDAANKSAPPASGRKPPRSPRFKGKSEAPKKRGMFASDTKDGAENEVDKKTSGNVSESKNGESGTTERKASDTTNGNKSDVKEKTTRNIVRSLIDDMQDSVKIAEEYQESSEIVNFGEYVDDAGNITSVCGVPTPNDDFVITQENAEEKLFDVSNPKEPKEPDTRAGSLEALLEMEREEQEREAKCEERRKQKEERNFGSGLAKGFFGSSPAPRAPPIGTTEVVKPDATGVIEESPVERTAVTNSVREKVGSARRRRRQKTKAVDQPTVFNVMGEKDEENGGEVDWKVPSRVSKFKQIRQGKK